MPEGGASRWPSFSPAEIACRGTGKILVNEPALDRLRALWEGRGAPVTGGGITLLQAKTANEVLKEQERRLRHAKLNGEFIERDRAVTLVFRLAARSGTHA